jgi:hypothetical protein
MDTPTGVCLKVKYLRPDFQDLREWCKDPDNVLVIRNGRVFVTDPITKKKTVFSYPASPWCNPYKLTEYSLDDSLRLYEEHLDGIILVKKEEFLKLLSAKRIGCYCEPGDRCHRDVIIKKLKSLV